ncbi:cytochrome c biogenesis protein CcdA [Flavobacterium sp. SUN052]|uniref:protein-disulfide reductase DsbD family protein n=1 Tax=Flavobacterium sp. SUN052 TaxID=3002441 RepID=UPI00237E9647|nr:thioredoxin family protein [Flavobacterium sp. SUN052]MEC4003611.1 cytochrome c biogenesis protein CcdA [Flavobacterium sp. SUN052]
MKKIILILLAFFALTTVSAQIKKPVKWTAKTEKISDTEFNLVMNATIEEGWHMYSQFTPDDGPLPITLKFKNQKGNFELIGKAKESPYQKQFNKDFAVDEYFFENKATLTQKVKITNPKTAKIDVNIDFQACQNACINDNKDLTFEIPVTSKTETALPTTVDTSKAQIKEVDTAKAEVKAVSTEPITSSPKEEKKGLWTIFFLAFLGGFAALLTPCVFPMIPMTVSFFTKQSKTPAQGKRNAILYGISIIAIYVILGLTINAIFGAKALNALSTNVWFNIIFFILLIVFAASFLGAFEIMLPNSWANKVDRQADRGGVIGIFFMALALAIVSFSCTGPIVGTLLVESASKGGIAPVIGMLGFSSAIALPFMLFALFPAWMNSLPKSGGWLNTVKVSLGFLELAFAFKFLSNADLVLQLHYFERETFLAIWIAIFGTWGIYLLGKITLPHDSPLTHISVGRLTLALLVLSFTFYMIPGLFGAPLKIISAFTPPQTYSESPRGFIGSSNSTEKLPDGAEFGPNGLMIFTSYDVGIAYAKEVKKPVLLDFTGHACSNCRKMENNVWTDENVSKILKNEVVIISLFADDKRDLPKNEQFISKSTGSEIVTIGDKWTDFMITKYNTNTQPLYVLVDTDGTNLNPEKPTTSYNPDVKLYENWLKQGIKNFKK